MRLAAVSLLLFAISATYSAKTVTHFDSSDPSYLENYAIQFQFEENLWLASLYALAIALFTAAKITQIKKAKHNPTKRPDNKEPNDPKTKAIALQWATKPKEESQKS